jgi:HPt (histidine-containing phosphotransfer) domain-containing protein
MSNDVEYEAENDDNISVDSLDNNESYTDKTEWFIDIDGIDYESAIASCGSEDSLKAVLEIFHESIDERASELEGYYNAEDWDNYTIKVHAMKSSARLIGATGIADDAQALENAGKEHNIDYINEHHAGLIKAYRDLEKPLDEIFGAVIKEVEDSPEEISDTFIQDDFIDEIIESVYEVIREGASSQDVSMIESALAEVEEYEIPEIDMDRLDILKGCLERQAFDEIIKVIDNIAR